MKIQPPLPPLPATLLQQLLPRLPVIIAVVFGLYSLALFGYAYQSWQRMKTETDTFLVADNQRRAIAVADHAAELRAEAERHADLQEIRAYLANRDLGMSLRYGLNASLQAIDDRLAQHAAHPWNDAPSRLVYLDNDGQVLADTQPEAELPAFAHPPYDQTRHTLDVDAGRFIVVVPVSHRTPDAGAVVTISPLQSFYRNLLTVNASSGYREFLLTTDGRELPGRAGSDPAQPLLPPAVLKDFVAAPENRVLSSVSFPEGHGLLGGQLVVKTSLPDLPLVLVTLLPEDRAHGRLANPVALGVMGLVPLLLLLAALWFDRQRMAAERLREDVRVAEEKRLWAEERNLALETEVTRREQVERALKESEERWTLAVAGTNDGIWDWNIETGDVFYSERWLAMIGYAPGELPNRVEAWQALLHPDDVAQTLATVQRHLCGASDFLEIEFRLRCKDGSYKWIRGRGKAQFGTNGKPLRIAGSHTDITEARMAEARLRDRNEQLDAIFALSPDGFVSFDGARRIKYASPAFLRMTGLQEGEIVGLDETEFAARCSQLCHAAAAFPGFAALRKIGAGETADSDGARSAQRQLIELNGPGKRVLEVGLRQSQAETVSQILYCRDVTHETELDRMKSEFLSTAAHELRTPMASVLGFAEVMMTPELEFDLADQRDYIATIYRNAELMAKIVNELLDLARIEARRGKDFRMETLAPDRLLDHIVADFKPPAGRDRPLVHHDGSAEQIIGDRDKLNQAVSNVLSNAYKYSPAGGAVELRLTRRDGAGEGGSPQIGIQVRDTGIGMTAAQAARVWERFYRADTSGKIPGTGLGMSIVKEIIELHGGSAELTSEVGAGTTVSLWLPVAEHSINQPH